MQDRDVTAQIWRITPKYGQKKKVTQNLRNFLIHIARHFESAAESDQPHSFLARLPFVNQVFFREHYYVSGQN